MSSSNPRGSAKRSSSDIYADYPDVAKLRETLKDADSNSLHNIINGVIDNAVEYSVNKVAAKAGRVIHVTVDDDGGAIVADEGVGISNAIDRNTGKRNIELSATQYTFTTRESLLMANAASSSMSITSKYGGYAWSQTYEAGVPQGDVQKGIAVSSTGTIVEFVFDETLFVKGTDYDHIRLVEKLSGLAHSHAGVKFILKFKDLEDGVFYTPNIEEQMDEWVAAHGSWRLKKAVERGYKAKGIYLRERLQSELPDIMPGFILDTQGGNPTHRSCINPTERALRMEEDIAEKLKKKYPNVSTTIVWSKEAMNWDGQVKAVSVREDTEMIMVEGLYGFKAYLPVSPSKTNPLKALLETPGVEEVWFDNYRTGFFSVAGNSYSITETIFTSGNDLRQFVETTLNDAGHNLMDVSLSIGSGERFSWSAGEWYPINKKYSLCLTQHSSDESSKIGFVIKLTK